MTKTYKDYVYGMVSRNPSLIALSDFLARQPRGLTSSVVSYAEFEQGKITPSRVIGIDILIQNAMKRSSEGSIAVIENLHPDDVETLGSSLDIDPFFFGGHIASSYHDVDKRAPPPLASILPS